MQYRLLGPLEVVTDRGRTVPQAPPSRLLVIGDSGTSLYGGHCGSGTPLGGRAGDEVAIAVADKVQG